ncbi:hypothetical protein JTE90_017098 [Oedothorax gibbosus]|uniref:Ras-GEF domain-containing protein n=1 Tax=Oedothorax gibbosus TaxID=931172 RepID=A0AAV6UH87_9ARAC|nr:hypothetical protein JTE90_017098 [Oedothorax gibbosus]
MPKYLTNMLKNIFPCLNHGTEAGPLVRASPKKYAEMSNPPFNKENTPNVDAFKDQHNFVTNWAVSEILTFQQAKNRAKLISFFIKLAVELRKINNVNSLVAVLVALRTAAIHRLEKTWDLVPKALKKKFEKMCHLIESDFNMTDLRRLQDEMKTPCLPYIAEYQSDVIRVEEMLKKFPRGEEEKAELYHKQMLNIFRPIEKCQKSNYDHLKKNALIEAYFHVIGEKLDIFKMTAQEQNNFTFKLSKDVEP